MRGLRFGCALVFVMGLVLMTAGLAPAQGTGSRIDVVELTGVIDPPLADYASARLASAETDADAVVLQLDTPGGLDIPMREIIQDILDSDVPVIVWIAPRGARAASAGTFITYAAHRAYMASATELGAATPVNLGGGDTLDRKVLNDAVAYIRELAVTTGRNADWAEDAVREAASIGATEAVELGVVDGIASSLEELLRAVDGEAITLASGEAATLETWDEASASLTAVIRFQQMNPFQRLLHAITDPEVAFFLMLIGFFGIIFEIYNPGIGLAGILGGVALAMAFYALNVLPTNWVGVLLLVLAVVFMIVDLHTAGLGVWTAGGLIAMVAGGLVLFAGAAPALGLSPWAIAGGVVFTLIFFISVMTAALRVRLRRPITGEDGIIGEIGEAKTDIAPEGTVFTKGALWRARTMETGIAAGEKVLVKASEGLVLLVEPYHEGNP